MPVSKRRKTDRLPTFSTLEEAAAAIDTIRKLDMEVAELEEEAMTKRVAATLAINQEYEPAVEAKSEAATILFHALAQFAESNPDLFDKKKSVETASGKFGFRTTPGSLKVPKKHEGDLIDYLGARDDLKHCVATKTTIDKNSVKALNKSDFEALSQEFGIEIDQRDEFFVQAADTDTERTKGMSLPEVRES